MKPIPIDTKALEDERRAKRIARKILNRKRYEKRYARGK